MDSVPMDAAMNAAMGEIRDVGWRTRDTSDRGWTGAWIGAAIAVVATIGGAAFGAPYLALGIPAAAMSGWIVGRHIRPDGGTVGPALAMAVVTVVVGDTMVVGGLIAAAAAAMAGGGGGTGTAIPEAMGGSIFLWGAGLMVVGIPMLVVTIPCGLIWAVVARRQERSAASRVADA